MIKDYLEVPRHCRKCKELTLKFRPSRVKRNDWICEECSTRLRRRDCETPRHSEESKNHFKKIQQMELFA